MLERLSVKANQPTPTTWQITMHRGELFAHRRSSSTAAATARVTAAAGHIPHLARHARHLL
jgi:hypothetical protein